MLLIAFVICMTFVGCSSNPDLNVSFENALIKESGVASALARNVSYDGALEESVVDFCAKITAPAVNLYSSSDNTAVSPISIYFALAMLSECASGDTRNEILSVLNVDYATLNANIKNLCEIMNVYYEVENKDGEDVKHARLTTANSVWLNNGSSFNMNCIETLANNYNASTLQADFRNDNKTANALIRDYVKQQTEGLIDRDFGLDPLTVFALINTLYLQESWNKTGSDISVTREQMEFTNGDGTKVSEYMLYRSANARRHVGENFSSFYVMTANGYTMYFILPNDGTSAVDAMSESNIKEALTASYSGYDAEKNIKYITTCYFPEYKASYDKDLVGVLKSFGVGKAFSGSADFSGITSEKVFCNEVLHATELEVGRKGIKGVAVTLPSVPTSAGPSEIKKVYETFEVNKSFGYVLTDPNDIPIFSGVINKI